MKIYLDDLRDSPSGWIRTYTVEETINLLSNIHVTEISLDHDLGLHKRTGYCVLNWIEEQVMYYNYTPPKIHIHTSNPSARKKMELATKNILKMRRKV